MTIRARLLVLALFTLHQASGLSNGSLALENDSAGGVADFTPTCDYEKKYGSSHTMVLPPNPDCKIKSKGVSEADKAFILKLMNTLRSKVANGLELSGKPGPQPAAKNMKELKWNDELAAFAQAWTQQCPKVPNSHDDNRLMCDHDDAPGQNYAWGVGGVYVNWQNRIMDWYNEVGDFDKAQVEKFTNEAPPKKMIGHYTQIVWAETEEVGCGLTIIPYPYMTYIFDEGYFVCNFYPSGNSLGAKVYDPKGSCPNGKSAKYPSLCA